MSVTSSVTALKTATLAMDDPNRVRVILLMGSNPDEQYNTIVTSASGAKDNWLYILKNGKGYLGREPLFGGDAERFCIIESKDLESSTNYVSITPERDKVYYIMANNAKSIATKTVIDPDTGTTSTVTEDMPLDQGKFYIYDGTNFVDLTYVAFQTMMADYITNVAVHAATSRPATGVSGTVVGGIDNTHNEQTIPTTQAVYDYINAQSILHAQFFRKVDQITITSSLLADVLLTGSGEPNEHGELDWVYKDKTNNILYPENTHGLLFTLDNDNVDNNTGNNSGTPDATEIKYFIDLTDYIKEIDIQNTPSVHLDVASSTNTHSIKADLNIKSGENSLLIDSTAGSEGVYLNKTTSDTTGTTATTSIPKIGDTSITTSAQAIAAASPDKLVTEEAFVVYMENFFKPYLDTILDDFVSYDILPAGTGEGSESSSEPEPSAP